MKVMGSSLSLAKAVKAMGSSLSLAMDVNMAIVSVHARVPSRCTNGLLILGLRCLPLARRPYRKPVERHDLGRMNVPCRHCGALHWMAERLAASSDSNPLFGLCCNSGAVYLPPQPDPPPAIRDLFTGRDAAAKEFRENIRQYNATSAFTSLGVKIDESVNNSCDPAPYVFRIHGELCHRAGFLIPQPPRAPEYSQL